MPIIRRSAIPETDPQSKPRNLSIGVQLLNWSSV